MISIASLLDFKSGANPPSSPTAVFSPLDCNIFFRCNEEEVKSLLKMKNCKPIEIFSKLRDLKDNF